MQAVIAIILIFIYAGLAAYVWSFWKNRPLDYYPLSKELAILAIALLLHGYLVFSNLLSGHSIVLSFGHALNLLTWLILLMYFSGSFFYSLKGLQIILYPIVVGILPLTLIFPGRSAGYTVVHLPFVAHVTSSMLAYCLFGIASLFAVLIILLEKGLRQRKMSPLMRFLPPLLSLEKQMFQAVWVGFVLLSVAVISGTFFTQEVFGQPFRWTHKSIFGIASWLIYAILLYFRRFGAWRGKKAAVWTCCGFFSLMLAYIGSKFVLEILLNQ